MKLWFWVLALFYWLFLLLFFLVYMPLAYADDGSFYQRRAEGWFWYQALPEPVETIPPETSTTSPSETKFSSAWFRKYMQGFMDQAIDQPTPENVRTYLYLQRIMLDKGSRFAEMSQQVVMGDPWLDEISRRPLATFAAKQMDQQAASHQTQQLQHIAKQAGLFFFYRADCPYCHKQAPIIASFAQQFGFEVTAIALDGEPLPQGLFPNYKADTGQAHRLGVNTVPALFLVKPPTEILPLAQGSMSFVQLKQRVILAAYQAQWIDEADYQKTRPIQAQPTFTAHALMQEEQARPLPAELLNLLAQGEQQ